MQRVFSVIGFAATLMMLATCAPASELADVEQIASEAHEMAGEAVYKNVNQDARIDDLEAQLADLQTSVIELEQAQRRARISSLSRLSPY